MGVGVLGGQLDPLLQERGQGVVVLVLHIDGGKGRAGFLVVLLEPQDFLVLDCRLFRQVPLPLQVGELAVRLQRLLVQLDGRLVRLGGGIEFLRVDVGAGELELQDRVGRVSLDQFAVLFQRLVEAPPQRVDVGQALPCLVVFRGAGQHLAVFHHGLVEERLPLVDPGQVEVELGVFSLVAQRVTVVAHRLVVAPHGEQAVGEPLLGHGVGRLFGQPQPVLADRHVVVLGRPVLFG